MKYFRFTKPKYALIAANSAEKAIQLYKEENGYCHTNINYMVEQLPLDHLDTNQREILMLKLLSNNPKTRKELIEQENSKGQMLIDSLSYEEHFHPDHELDHKFYKF